MMFETEEKSETRNERKQSKQQEWYVYESKCEASIDIEGDPWVNGREIYGPDGAAREINGVTGD